MDFKALANHLRKPPASLAVRDIIIITDQGDFTGYGKITFDNNQMALEVITSGDREIQLAGGRVFSRDEFWKIGGVIEGQIPFWAFKSPARKQVAIEPIRNGEKCRIRLGYYFPSDSAVC